MKQNLLSLFLAILVSPLLGQITLTTDHFPEVGDTLRVATAVDPNIELGDAGQDVIWDYTSLVGPVFESVILDPTEGNASASFSTATAMTGQLGASETYFQATSNTYTELGFSGADSDWFGLEVIFKNEPPRIERRAGLNYPDLHTSESSVRVPFAWADLPTVITDSLGNLPVTPDSIAIEVAVERLQNVDAWGTVQLPIGDYDVLRVRRRTLTETKLMALVPIFGWTDVSGFVPNDLLGVDTSLSYRYYSNDAKEEIVILNVDPVTEQIANVRFKSDNSTTSLIRLHTGKTSIHAYPNPAINTVQFDVVNMPSGVYNLKMYNILGTEVWNESYPLANQQDTIRVNLYNFKKGTYLYSLIDESGRPIVTRRLMIIRP